MRHRCYAGVTACEHSVSDTPRTFPAGVTLGCFDPDRGDTSVQRFLRIVRQPFAVPPLARGWQRAVPVLLAIGTATVLGGLTIIWAARLTVERPVYVSELGAEGAPTAGMFRIALLLIAAGGLSIALASGHVRSR